MLYDRPNTSLKHKLLFLFGFFFFLLASAFFCFFFAPVIRYPEHRPPLSGLIGLPKVEKRIPGLARGWQKRERELARSTRCFSPCKNPVPLSNVLKA